MRIFWETRPPGIKKQGPTLVAGLLAICIGALSVNAQRWHTNTTGPVVEWEVKPQFKSDVFTFVRVKYHSGRRNSWGGWGDQWAIDYPDSDLNFSYRLQEVTSLKVNPEPIYLELTDSRLLDYPFIYMLEPGDLIFSEPEVDALRKYLLGGGFLMVDDFWGEYEWQNFRHEIKRVFPDREPKELDITHPIFNYVFPLKEKPQIPNVRLGTESQWNGGRTWERYDARTPHYKAITDDQNRIMVMICHNTDLGDGWEWEGANEYYFREFSEKKAYPLGINIVVYALTH